MAKGNAKAPAAPVTPSWVKQPEASAPVAEQNPTPEAETAAETTVAAETQPEASAPEATAPEATTEVSAAEQKVATTTVMADKAFNFRLTHEKMIRIEAGVQELDPETVKALLDNKYALAHGFRVYTK